ncbi:MAG TPA: ECF-type riboflavin transporter substrate-binding protein [Treponema sp.]|nr:ECF-type riboflavin transporter substrate-binding protein [Treponema sp.]HCA19997.1 ECF-type riboflavin transporter substrate-binding protein [Treponema sp.]
MASKGKSIIKQVVAIGIGAAIFVALTTVQIPVGFVPNTALQVRAAVLAFFAAVFGPVAGFAIGFIGHALGDALFYGSVWWSWVIPDGVFGLLVGLFVKKYAIEEGGFGVKQLVTFNVVQLLANAVSWAVIAPVFDILIYKEPANKVFVQGLTAFAANFVIILIVGSLLAWGYSKIKTKSGSLKAE